MSKRKKNWKPNIPPARLTPDSVPATESLERVLGKVEEAAYAHATEADLQAMEAAPPPPANTSGGELVARAVELVALLDSQLRRHESAEADVVGRAAVLDEQESKLKPERNKLETLRGELAERDERLSEREKKLEAEEAALLRRQEDIVKRELDADAGFSRRNRLALAQLEAEGEELRAQFTRHRKTMEEERTEFESELQVKRDQFTADAEAQRVKHDKDAAAMRSNAELELTSQHERLNRERESLATEAKQQRKLSCGLALDRELLDEDREAFDEKVAQRAAREVELKNGEIRAVAERLDAARAERDRFAQLLADREEADRRFGGETPNEVLKRMRALEKESEKLRKALGGRPSAEAAQRLEELERQQELWESDRLKLLGDLGEARQEAARKRIAVTELESLRDEKRALESANALLHEANRQLRVEVDALVKGVEGKSPFPTCSQMDTNNKLQSTPPTTDVIPSLREFAEEVRHRIAWNPESKKELYYSTEDVRSFLGGLAMSRLHLLQGISGTGKTSLPLAFARAIGAGDALIEVRAGWRDHQDLVGHFNTFERRFDETKFLQALYRASTPYFRNKPFVIVLDEMNLSHPEQYFSDLLSALERDQNSRQLVLMTAAVDPAPRLLADGGMTLPIPPNVWFIGTANHDETTKDFADKTYDRAHVMELPRNREVFSRKKFQPQNPVSLEALQNAFNTAVQTHERDAGKAYEFFQNKLGEILGRRFRVGWGNRLEQHLGSYVPVVIAAGGTVGEATDHILATKLLRKIRDRHDNRPEDITALRDHIEKEWSHLDKQHKPRRSLALLHEELHRLGHDDS